MKKILYLFLLFLPVLGVAQSRYGVEGVPMCWRTPLGVDSSLNRYVIISTTGKPVQTIVYENANGVVVTVAGGSMRYGYCDCIDFTVPDSSVTWEMLTQPVKDSIRHKRDTFITVPLSTNYFQNTIDNPAKFYNNIHFSCKGRTDTSIVAFLGAPVWEEQKGVVYHIKNDSGLVAAFILTNGHLSNSKIFYLLQRGQTAQVRLLPDAANGGNYGWAVNVVWDSIGGGGGNGIYGGSDSLSQENTYAAMAADGSQVFGLGYWPYFPDRYYDNTKEFGLFINRDYGEVSLVNKNAALGAFNSGSTTMETYNSTTGALAAKVATSRVFSRVEIGAYNNPSTSNNRLYIDTSGLFALDQSWVYQIIPKPTVSRPSATAGVTNILKWTAGVPSFGYRYEADTVNGDLNIKMNPNGQGFTLGYFPNSPSLTNPPSSDDRGFFMERNGPFSLVGIRSAFGLANLQSGVEFRASTAFLYSSNWGAGSSNFVSISPNSLVIQAQTSSATDSVRNLTLNGTWLTYKASSGAPVKMFPSTERPSGTGNAISNLIWTAGTPSFLRSQHKVVSGTTDGSGDITITFDAAMPDATYTVIVTGQGATPYVYMTQPATLATGSVKVRMFTLAGSAATSTAYQISYEVKDTN